MQVGTQCIDRARLGGVLARDAPRRIGDDQVGERSVGAAGSGTDQNSDDRKWLASRLDEDVLEITGDDEFLLHGRTADLVNIAGKRSSFGYLNAQLTAIPGVIDGAFFLRGGGDHDGGDHDGGDAGIARLAAAVVAPGLDANTLVEHLRRRIDPVFLPRPLLMVDRLPRNATGKLPLQALQALCDGQSQKRGSPQGSS